MNTPVLIDVNQPLISAKPCPNCDGTGVDAKHIWPDGTFASCERCEGTGYVDPEDTSPTSSSLPYPIGADAPQQNLIKTTMHYGLFISRFSVFAILLNDTGCGTGQKDHFDCEIEVESDALDDKGFIIEVSTIPDAIKNVFADFIRVASCEQLCETVTRVVINRVEKNMGEPPTSVGVRVWNGHGYVYSRWSVGDTLPEIARQATDSEIEEHRNGTKKASVC